MESPLEKNPKILEKIGLFIVLFNLIDFRLGTEFYYIINQSDPQKSSILNFLSSQDFSKKLDILKSILGNNLYSKIKNINEFRNFIAHGIYGTNGLDEISISKLGRGTGKYHTKPLEITFINEYIEKEREALLLLHELSLKRISKKQE